MMAYRSYKMLTIMGFLALLPGVRRGLARKLIMEWTIFGDALDDVYLVKDILSDSGGYYFMLGNRAAAVVIDAYRNNLLPMKPRESVGNPFMAQRYVDTARRLPDFIDKSLRIVPGSRGVHGVQQCEDTGRSETPSSLPCPRPSVRRALPLCAPECTVCSPQASALGPLQTLAGLILPRQLRHSFWRKRPVSPLLQAGW